MSDSQYTYAVAAIRVKESRLFSATLIEQLIACPSYEGCLQFLMEKGWGEADTPLQAEAILSCEERKTRDTLTELVKDENIIAVLDCTKVFHNLKAAIKEYCSSQAAQNIYIKGTVPSPMER